MKINYRLYPAEELDAMPTLSIGWDADLKLQTRRDGHLLRYWLSRLTPDDGEEWQVTVETLDETNGKWKVYDHYARFDDE